MKEADVQKLLRATLGSGVSNIYVYKKEIDFLHVTTKMMLWDLEIKTSWTDLKREIDSHKNAQFYVSLSMGPKKWDAKFKKHVRLISGNFVNRYYIVIPNKLKRVINEIPQTWGIITYKTHEIEIIKQSKLFRSNRVDQIELDKILWKLTAR